MKKLFYILILCATTSFADTSVCDSDNGDWSVERGWSAAGDLLLVRPLGAAATVAGFGLFAVCSPFAAMADATDEVFDTLVRNPADYTFDRDLGVWNK